MRNKRRVILKLCVLVVVFAGSLQFPAFAIGATAGKVNSPEEVLAGFDERVDELFRSESGKWLVRAKKKPPLHKGRGNYVRGYSYSIMAFAARCCYLNQMIDQANAALIENAQYYLDNPLCIGDRDSFHWHADIVMRLIEMYGTNGSKKAGLIKPEAETLLLKPISIYAIGASWEGKSDYKNSKTWHVYSSENHHSMDFTLCWHFAKLAKDRPEYKNLKYQDGSTAKEQYRRWNEYFVEYCRQRACKSICIEMMSAGYNSTWIRGFYNFYDFGEPKVRKAAGMLLDLYFAYWAQEQMGGISGGGKSRIYFNDAFRAKSNSGMASLAWLYFGIGRQLDLKGHEVNAALSGYRPPAVVVDIALDVKGRGRYEVIQRAQGLGKQGSTSRVVTRKFEPNRLRTDGGGIVRYSYCDPSFIMGTAMFKALPNSDWVAISTQNRWQGVIFSGDHDARIVPIARPKNSYRGLNGQWSVQSKGTLITQKVKYHRGVAEMIVWLSKDGLSKPVEKNGVVFVRAEGAYAAIRVPSGGYKWVSDPYVLTKQTGETVSTRPGRTLVVNQEYAPVIVEVMAKNDIESFDAFMAKVLSTKTQIDGPVLKYRSIYGDLLEFDTSFSKAPRINSKPVNYEPRKVFESPFLNSDYNSGVVTISKGKRKKVLDFGN